MLRIAIYAENPGRREELTELVAAIRDARVVGAAGSASALLAMLAGTPADIVIAADMPRLDRPSAMPPIIAVLEGEDEAAALGVLAAGASAVLSRAASPAALGAAIAAARQGLRVLPRDLCAALLGIGSGPAPGQIADQPKPELTPREIEVLAAMADGASNKMIARRLGISFHTAKFHVASILAKLDAETRTEAVSQAARLGLVML